MFGDLVLLPNIMADNTHMSDYGDGSPEPESATTASGAQKPSAARAVREYLRAAGRSSVAGLRPDRSLLMEPNPQCDYCRQRKVNMERQSLVSWRGI